MATFPAGSTISAEDFQSSVRVGFLFTSLTKALLTYLLSLAGHPTQGSVLVVPNFHFTIIEATASGNTKSFRNCFITLD